MTPKNLLAYAQLAYRFRCEEWATDFHMSTHEFRDRVEGVGRSVDRLADYVRVVEEAEKFGDAGMANFYRSILEKEFGYSKDMPRPDLSSWWPIGLNHNIPAIEKKYAPKED